MTATIALPRRQPHSDWLARLRTIGLALGGRGVMGLGLGRSSAGAVAATPWWLAGGVSAANAVAVYQPKGAASLAASYTNLANPGTYDVAPGVAPTFSVATGWSFNGSTQYLNTGVVAENNQGWSLLLRWSDLGFGGFLGMGGGWAANKGFGVAWNTGSTPDTYYYFNGAIMSAGEARTAAAGVSAIAGNTAYFDGAVDGGTIASTTGTNAYPFFIGGWNDAGPAYIDGASKVQAVAIYDTVLSGAQVAALTAAMQAL